MRVCPGLLPAWKLCSLAYSASAAERPRGFGRSGGVGRRHLHHSLIARHETKHNLIFCGSDWQNKRQHPIQVAAVCDFLGGKSPADDVVESVDHARVETLKRKRCGVRAGWFPAIGLSHRTQLATGTAEVQGLQLLSEGAATGLLRRYDQQLRCDLRRD